MNNLGLPLSRRVMYDYVLGERAFSVDIFAIKIPEVTIKLVFNPEVPTAKLWGSIFSSVQSSSQQTQAKSPWTLYNFEILCWEDSSLVSANSDLAHMEILFRGKCEHLCSNRIYCKLSVYRSSLRGLTNTPVSPSKLPTKRLKSYSQVLSSAEFIQKMDEA